MRATLTKEFRFEASHRLKNHDGKCAKPHGHSYRAIIEVEGDIKATDGTPQEGMVMDFATIKDDWKQVEPKLDHCDLNTTIGPEVGPTTAENIANWILDNFFYASAVTLYETATSSATVRR